MITDNLIGKKVLVRAYEAGVYYGTLLQVEGNVVILSNARNIWYWSGACSLMELSLRGAKNKDNCKFSVIVDEITILNVCEILPCTEEAITNIESVSVWKY